TQQTSKQRPTTFPTAGPTPTPHHGRRNNPHLPRPLRLRPPLPPRRRALRRAPAAHARAVAPAPQQRRAGRGRVGRRPRVPAGGRGQPRRDCAVRGVCWDGGGGDGEEGVEEGGGGGGGGEWGEWGGGGWGWDGWGSGGGGV